MGCETSQRVRLETAPEVNQSCARVARDCQTGRRLRKRCSDAKGDHKPALGAFLCKLPCNLVASGSLSAGGETGGGGTSRNGSSQLTASGVMPGERALRRECPLNDAFQSLGPREASASVAACTCLSSAASGGAGFRGAIAVASAVA